jgi:hypothetical protein
MTYCGSEDFGFVQAHDRFHMRRFLEVVHVT